MMLFNVGILSTGVLYIMLFQPLKGFEFAR